MENGSQYSETINLMSKLATHTVLWRVSKEINVNVKVRDMRMVWGRTDLLIEPISGTGSQWVSADSCKIVD